MKHRSASAIAVILGLAGMAALVFTAVNRETGPTNAGSSPAAKPARMPRPGLLAMMANHQFNKLHDPLPGEIPPGIRGRELAFVNTLPAFDDAEQSATCITQDRRSGKRNIWYYGTGEMLSTTSRNISTNARTQGIGAAEVGLPGQHEP